MVAVVGRAGRGVPGRLDRDLDLDLRSSRARRDGVIVYELTSVWCLWRTEVNRFVTVIRLPVTVSLS